MMSFSKGKSKLSSMIKHTGTSVSWLEIRVAFRLPNTSVTPVSLLIGDAISLSGVPMDYMGMGKHPEVIEATM